ncbi:MAG TPA: substrate-binding domain-containing protein [Verrucomicrobiota bacterium]|nr:substrate-binding domain-containing protein [Verrucomicrobiota bacterium]
MNKPWMLVTGSVAAMALLVWGLWWPARSRPAATTAGSEQKPLLMFCAAGLQAPVEAAAHDYEQAFGVRVQLQYGGSGALLSNLRVTHTGDLYLAADESYTRSARAMGLLAEIIPLARQRPVIAVARGNPKQIRTLADLQRPDVRVGMANPEAASIGRTVRERLQHAGQWDALARHITVFKPTVNDVANDVKLGTVDAGIVWDATAQQYPELELVTVPPFDAASETISIGILQRSPRAAAALRFARYLGARDRGLKRFQEFHYDPVAGDAWAEQPELVLYSGAMLRPGLEQTLQQFQEREGCRITTVYNGCGILVAQMRAGQRPDAYFSCDTSFMNSVADLYQPPVDVVDNRLMIIVQKHNPKNLHALSDLTRPGIRLGLPDHEKSAMGNVIWKMLVQLKLYDALRPNLAVESPTGDFLINQIRTGSLDAIIACHSNWTGVRDHLDAVPIEHPLARLTQPYAVGRETRYPHLMARLEDAITSAASRARFESQGFGWRFQPASPP